MKNRTKKIFVGGVPVEMTEETIREYFKTFGEVSLWITFVNLSECKNEIKKCMKNTLLLSSPPPPPPTPD